MLIKSFQAATIQKALDQVKREFGDDAVILKTDIINSRGRKSFSVTAAHDYQTAQSAAGTIKSQTPRTTRPAATASRTQVGGDRLTPLLADLLLPKILDEPGRSCYLGLRENEVAEELALSICRQLGQSDGSLWQDLSRMLKSAMTNIAELPQVGKQVFLVGPPGSGKTSTLAKLAAQLVFCEARQVKLSTLDNFRPTAEAEIENLAEILAFVEGEREQAREQREDEMLLIDSEGLGPGDNTQLGQLKRAIEEVSDPYVILVLSATASWTNNRFYLDFFEPLGADAIVVSGLDLTETCGTVVNIAAGDYPPLLGVTCSRMPTAAIEALEPEKHLRRFLGVFSG